MLDVRDIAAVAVACITEAGREGRKYAVTGGEALSNGDIAQKLTALLGRRISYYDVTPQQAEESLEKAGAHAWMIDSLLKLFAICKAGYAAGVSPAVEQILRRKPISFDQFLADNAHAFHEDEEAARMA